MSQIQVQVEQQAPPTRPIRVTNCLIDGHDMRASQAIVIYTYGNMVEENCLCTINPIVNGQIGAGELLTPERYVELVAVMGKGQSVRRTIAPAHVLYHDASTMLWYRPAQRRPIFFRTANQKFNKDVTSKDVFHPALLFKAKGGALSIWALGSDERPTNESRIFHAPYFNVSFGGGICRGNSPYPAIIEVSTIDLWEKAFFETQFTHSNYHGKFVNHPKGHEGFWRAMVKVEGNVFPTKYLEPSKITIEEILNPKSK